MPAGKALQVPGAETVAQDSEERDQQKPLGIEDLATPAILRQGLQDSDQIRRAWWLGQGTGSPANRHQHGLASCLLPDVQLAPRGCLDLPWFDKP